MENIRYLSGIEYKTHYLFFESRPNKEFTQVEHFAWDKSTATVFKTQYSTQILNKKLDDSKIEKDHLQAREMFEKTLPKIKYLN